MSTISLAATPAPRSDWRAIVAADPDSLTEHLPQWVDAICSAGRFEDASRLYRFDDGRSFVVPLVRHTVRYGPRMAFGSGWGIGGIVGPDLDAVAVEAILADLAADEAIYTHLRPNPLKAAIWEKADTSVARSIPRCAHVLSLAGGLEATQRRFRKSGRVGIRRAERSGVEVSVFLGGEMLDVYYEKLYMVSVERWAERQREPLVLARARGRHRDPLAKLETLARYLGDSFRMYLAFLDGEPVAGNIVLAGPNNSHSTRGAMDGDKARGSRAAYAAEWASIKDACEAGHRSFQLGESGNNRSLSDYKERFGAEPIEYNEYRIERLPLLTLDGWARNTTKRLIGFRDH